MSPALKKGQLAERIGQMLIERRRAYKLARVNFRVVADEIRRERGWWQVPIQPDREPEPTYPYYELLAQVERELEGAHRIKALLLPYPAPAHARPNFPERIPRARTRNA